MMVTRPPGLPRSPRRSPGILGAWVRALSLGLAPTRKRSGANGQARLWPRLLAWTLWVGLAGACCPPLDVSYASPEATLRTWQAALCHDEPVGEYRCLSQGLQAGMGGFETYFAARQKLLRDDPLASFLLKHFELAERAEERHVTADGQHVTLIFEHSGQRFVLEFDQETAVDVVLDDGRRLAGRMNQPPSAYIGSQGALQWIHFSSPLLTPEERTALWELSFEREWKIASIQGLTP
jgi:hypothetical protein